MMNETGFFGSDGRVTTKPLNVKVFVFGINFVDLQYEEEKRIKFRCVLRNYKISKKDESSMNLYIQTGLSN